MDKKPKIFSPPAAFKSRVWRHFGFAAGEQGEVDRQRVICRHCYNGMAHSGGTTNLATHLRRHHPELDSETQTSGSQHAQAAPSDKKNEVAGASACWSAVP